MLNNVYMLRSYTDKEWQGEPLPLKDYERLGFRPAGAERWRRHAIPPHIARQYADLGLSPTEAEYWMVIPDLVEAYMEVGVCDTVVAEWVRQRVMPDEVPDRMAEHARAHVYADPWELDSKWSDASEGSDAQGPGDAAGEERYEKWPDMLDQACDTDWSERDEPFHPDEAYYDLDDPHHPHSPNDPFDPDGVKDPYAAGGAYAGLDADAPLGDDASPDDSDWLTDDPTRRPTQAGARTNVIPLFGRRDEDA